MRNRRLPTPALGLSVLCLCLGSAVSPLAARTPPPALQAQDGDAELIGALIQAGRAHLAERRPERAEALFTEAAALDDDAPRTRMWVYRAWMELGRTNDSLDAIDALQPGDVTDAARDYLYGMAFLRRAEHYITSGVTDSSVRMNFEDANVHLTRALGAEPERFQDALLPLAKAAWFTQDLEVARRAAERAVQIGKSDPRNWHQLGHVALSQFVTEQKADPPGAMAESHWESATAAFARAVAYFGRPLDDPEAQAWIADASTQLGHARMWKQDNSRAADAYAVAMTWAPDAFDYATVYGLLTRPSAQAPEESSLVYFRRAVEEGARRFREAFGEEEARDATLLWWLGWARFHDAEFPAAAAAFERCLAKNPDLLNGWVYLALARHELGDSAGSLASLRSGWEREPSVVVTELRTDTATNARRLALLIDRRYREGDLDGASFLAEVNAEVSETDAAQWNNLGFFLTERCKALRADESSAQDTELHQELAQRALDAYDRALELSPEDPGILNDTAVILQHHLMRDLERARALYTRAIELSQAALAAGELSAEQRGFHEMVIQDAEANLRELGE